MITLNQITFSTITEAIAAARALPSGTPRHISLTDTTISLTEPIELDHRDSFLHISGNATLTGGLRLTELTPDGDGNFTAPLPKTADPAALIVNGRFCERSRYPAQGTLQYLTTCDLKWLSSTQGGWNLPPTHDQLTRLQVRPEDIPAGFAPENAYLTVFHEWDESTVRVRSIDRTTGEILLASEMEHPAGAFGKSSYVFRGIREGLTVPGQWFFDRVRHQIVYKPLPGEEISALDVQIPLSDHIFTLKNAHHVTISGLTLTTCNNTHQRSGLRAINCLGALQAEDCDGLTLTDLKISATAGHGIRLLRCADSEISRCTIEHCGAGGIFEFECAPALVRNNSIRSIGSSNASSIGIHAGGKSQLVYVLDGYRDATGPVEILGNTITDTPYCAITCNGGPHCIEDNIIADCMTVLRDGAAIYSSRAKHTRIAGNSITRVGTGKGKSHGIYLDEGSDDCVLENNRLEDVSSPLMFHMSQNITVRRNLMTNSKGNIRISPATSFQLYFQENIITAAGAVEFLPRSGSTDTVLNFAEVFACTSNLIFSQIGSYGYFYHLGWTPTDPLGPLPKNNGLLRIDPKLTLTDGRITLAADSPLHWMDIPIENETEALP